MSLSPTGLLRAGWASAKMNMGTYVLYLLAMLGLYLVVFLGSALIQALAGSTVAALCSFVALLGFAGYAQLTSARLSYLGSGGAHVPLRALLPWDASLVGRFLLLALLSSLLMVAIILAGALVLGLPVYLVVQASPSVGAVLAVLAYLVFLVGMLYVSSGLLLAPMAALQGATPVAALGTSWRMSAGERWGIVGFWLLLMLVMVVPFLIPLVIMALVAFVGVADPGLAMALSILSFVCSLAGLILIIITQSIGIFGIGHIYRQLSSSAK